MKFLNKKMKLRACILLLMSVFFTVNVNVYAEAGGGSGGLESLCLGDFFNPVTDPNTNNFFPITIFGQAFGGSKIDNPPIMYTSALCMCPSIILQGVDSPGINISYWRPTKILDISRIPGCSPSLGGKVVLDGYENNMGSINNDEGGNSTRQIMEWDYDVIGILKVLEGLACSKISSISLAYDSNLDPTMNTLPNGALGESEAAKFFNNVVSMMSCVADAYSAVLMGWPLDFLPYCSGAQTNSYPYDNKVQDSNKISQLNFKVAVDHIVFKQAARFQEWVTIGPTAQCFSHPYYFPIKSAYRFDRTFPFADSGSRKLVVGTPLLIHDIFSRNTPATVDATILVWKANQCCMKVVP